MMATQICYCFGYTDEDIAKDVLLHNGRSTILERIVAERRNNNCRCAEMHPEHR